jgi:hypothetical protein
LRVVGRPHRLGGHPGRLGGVAGDPRDAGEGPDQQPRRQQRPGAEAGHGVGLLAQCLAADHDPDAEQDGDRGKADNEPQGQTHPPKELHARRIGRRGGG